jgi:hypothetical protein
MEDQTILALEMQAAEMQFRAQFDKSNPAYHNGDPTPVPVGGVRVPESMPSAYPDAPVVNDVPMDEVYYRLQDLRNLLGEFKKVLSSICPAIEAKLRAKKFKDVEKRETAVMERAQALIQVLQQAVEYKAKLMPCYEYVENYDATIDEIVEKGGYEYQEKEEYGEYMFMVTHVTQRIFKDQRIMLDRMKQIKKNS